MTAKSHKVIDILGFPYYQMALEPRRALDTNELLEYLGESPKTTEVRSRIPEAAHIKNYDSFKDKNLSFTVGILGHEL